MYIQKFLTLRNGEVTPMIKARISVSDVIVIDIPACLIVYSARFRMAASRDIFSPSCSFCTCSKESEKPDDKMNTSSRPIPEMIQFY